MSARVWIPVLAVASLALVLLLARRDSGDAAKNVVRPVEPAVAGAPAKAASLPRTAPQVAAPTPGPATPSVKPPRRPWPWADPPVPPALKEALRLLREKKVTLDQSDGSIPGLLAEISRQTGLLVQVDPGADLGDAVSFKVADIIADGALRLLLYPLGLGYRVREDGVVFVSTLDNVEEAVYPEEVQRRSEARTLECALRDLQEGRAPVDPAARVEDGLRAKKVLMPQGERTFLASLGLLREDSGLNILVDAAIQESHAGFLEASAPTLVEERTVGESLRRLCAAGGFGICVTEEGVVLVTTAGKAREVQGRREAKQVEEGRFGAALSQPLGLSAEGPWCDLVETFEKTLGVRVLLSREVWESPSTVVLAPGDSLRELLERLKPAGLRWTSRDGALCVMIK